METGNWCPAATRLPTTDRGTNPHLCSHDRPGFGRDTRKPDHTNCHPYFIFRRVHTRNTSTDGATALAHPHPAWIMLCLFASHWHGHTWICCPQSKHQGSEEC